jgi:hypothetical protein
VRELNRVYLSIIMILAVIIAITAFHLGNQAAPEITPDGSAAQTPRVTVAASDSSAAARASADYLCDGVDDQQEIQAALNALPATGGEVVLSGGMFRCTETIVMPSNATLLGQGAGETAIELENAIIYLQHENASLQDLSISGYRYDWKHQWDAPVFITASNVSIRDVTGTADNTVHAVFFVASMDATDDGKIIENIEFSGCRALDPGAFGFMLSASQAATNKLIRNVTFTDCDAINCGRYSRFDPWVTGFDFAEQNDIENLQVIRCRAEGNWESGFHVESSRNKTNVVMIDCISRENAQKEKTGVAQTFFGAGYLVNGDMRLINCTSEGNYIGFYCSGGGFEIVDCTERASLFGYALSNLADPGGIRLTSCSATGELYPIFFGRGDMAGVVLENLTISSGNASGEKAGITVTHDVLNAPEILIQDSRIQGYQYGINNTATDAVRVKGVEVSGAVVEFINCDVLGEPEPTPVAPMLLRVILPSSRLSGTLCIDSQSTTQ